MQQEAKIKAVKEVKSYGNLHLNSKDFPGVKKLKIGEKKTISIDVEVTGLQKPDRWQISEDGAKPTDIYASVTILKIDLPAGTEDKEEKEEM